MSFNFRALLNNRENRNFEAKDGEKRIKIEIRKTGKTKREKKVKDK